MISWRVNARANWERAVGSAALLAVLSRGAKLIILPFTTMDMLHQCSPADVTSDASAAALSVARSPCSLHSSIPTQSTTAMSARRTASAGALDSYYRNVLNNIPGAAPFDVCKAFSFLELVDKKSIPPHLANIMIQSLQQFRLKSKTDFPGDPAALSKPAQDLYYQFRQAQNWKQIVHAVTSLEPPNLRAGWGLPFPARFFEAR